MLRALNCFKSTCAYNLLDHIDPNTLRPVGINAETWNCLDSIVKSWIYSTISIDLLQSIMRLGTTAHQLWNRLQEIFQDNRITRVVYLEEQFNNTRFSAFSNVSNYYARLKKSFRSARQCQKQRWCSS